MKDGDGYVRLSVAEALGRIGDAGAVEALKEALKDEDGFVRERAVSALEKIETKQKQG